ncbi:lysylphosphatidylglycerol synthase domain-containing protein [Thermococcus sp. Bubb.Bath]|uniref:lysylphosphatidylglycerol synthase domain-containing protein n=1 Tax=Thermococcus sp. Bubb.Bath TaxID=1638242 RepID=UPI00143A1AF4|nr:lysylphosphatidylglycerol synthase domain-containing protein [Thermococcus sp. Bubb.Bath]NJF25631.1 flippase-like domain-containing protein [Thermococcus sp. Bubb.Bath]
MKRNLRRALSLALTIILAIFLFFRISKEVMTIELSEVEPLYFFLASLFGVFAYLVSTAVWYFLLRGSSSVGFLQLLRLNLMNSYLSMTLNSAVGNIVKAKYAMDDWWMSLGVISMVTVFEILPGTVVGAAFGNYSMLPFAFLFLWALVHEDSLYRIVVLPFKRLGREDWAYRFYTGWKKAKKGRFVEALLISPLQPLFLSLALVSTARAFGVHVSLWRGLLGVTYSTVLGGALGTPGGIGGNELGVVMAMGSVPAGMTIAFTYKFLTQYIYAVAGIVPFYRIGVGEE